VSPRGTYESAPALLTDFRQDLVKINVPTLVMHGTADRVLPLAATALPTHAAIAGSQLVTVEGAPHGLLWTHAEEANHTLLNFFAGRPLASAARETVAAS
jgi:non-heme chloroperoxidase